MLGCRRAYRPAYRPAWSRIQQPQSEIIECFDIILHVDGVTEDRLKVCKVIPKVSDLICQTIADTWNGECGWAVIIFQSSA